MDIWDPNTWNWNSEPLPVYLDDRATTFCLVDEVDYQWAIRWKWHINWPHPGRKGKKHYAVRCPGNGRLYRPKLYLHVEIMKRTGIVPPSDQHTMVDHIDSNEFNCCRSNLRWATPIMNARNVKGIVQKQAELHVRLDSVL